MIFEIIFGIFIISEGHSEVIKLLVISGSKLDKRNLEGSLPIDLVPHNSESWMILDQATRGLLPVIEEKSEVPLIPDYAIAKGTAVKKKKKKKGKKGKKGKKKK